MTMSTARACEGDALMTTVALLASGALAAIAGAWQAWLRLLRPRLVLRYVRRRYGRVAAWLVRTTGLHRSR
ncbi:MAG: hypothetical protein V9E83_03930 [Baekduia sp.]